MLRRHFLRRSALVIGTLAVLAASPISAARAASPAESFVSEMGDKAIGILSNHALGPADKQAQFRTLFLQNFDTDTIGSFVLGRYKRAATPEQIATFNKLYAEDIVQTYNRRLSVYSGEIFQVTGSQVQGDETLVRSQVLGTKGRPATHVEWRLGGAPGNFKVIDVVIENLSMRQAQRDDFASVIGSRGLDGLIAALQRKVGSAAR